MRDNQTGPINHTNDVNIKDQNINKRKKTTLNLLIDILLLLSRRNTTDNLALLYIKLTLTSF